jgi:hypothetical protein
MATMKASTKPAMITAHHFTKYDSKPSISAGHQTSEHQRQQRQSHAVQLGCSRGCDVGVEGAAVTNMLWQASQPIPCPMIHSTQLQTPASHSPSKASCESILAPCAFPTHQPYDLAYTNRLYLGRKPSCCGSLHVAQLPYMQANALLGR